MKTSKAYFVILVFLFISVKALAQRDTIIIKEGVKLSGKVDNKGRKIGKWIGTNQSGTKLLEATYQDDEMVGNIKRWDENGRITEDYNVSQRKKNGQYSSWKYTGDDYEFQSGEYIDNQENGLWITKNSKNQIQSQSNYKLGKPHGDLIIYYPSQEIKTLLHFSNDSLLNYYEYYENGDLQYEFTSTGGDKTGDIKSYYPNKKPKSHGKMDDGNKVGRWYFYDEAGKKTSEDFLVVTKKGSYPGNNVIYHYLKDGTLEYTEHYELSSDCTILTYYDNSGKVKTIKYKKDGKIISEKEYNKGIEDVSKSLLKALQKSNPE